MKRRLDHSADVMKEQVSRLMNSPNIPMSASREEYVSGRRPNVNGWPMNDVRRWTLRQRMEVAERKILLEVLEDHDWSRTRTASALGISRSSLFYKMRRYGLLKPAPDPVAENSLPTA